MGKRIRSDLLSHDRYKDTYSSIFRSSRQRSHGQKVKYLLVQARFICISRPNLRRLQNALHEIRSTMADDSQNVSFIAECASSTNIRPVPGSGEQTDAQ